VKLYLVQHGDSLPKETDPNRPLSKKGRADVTRLAAFLKGRVRAARTIHSGKTRARQTTELLAAAIAPGQKIEVLSGIDPMDPTAPVAEQVQHWNEDTLIVGHLPFMCKLVARLVNGAEEPGIVAYQPGSVACLERSDDGRWTVVWMLRPELLSEQF